jgi:hypothetical protein
LTGGLSAHIEKREVTVTRIAGVVALCSGVVYFMAEIFS